MERGGGEAEDPWEEVGEKPGSLAQEGALGLQPPELLEEGEGYDLRVGEPLEGGVAWPFGVEVGV